MKKFLALKASAGSGKTFALTVRYISLLLKGATPTSILALTFTNKAANEMSERVFKTLKTLGEDKTYLEQISLISEVSQDEILNQKDYLLDRFLNSELSIYTIDKFVNKILREFCGYLGMSDDFSIKSDDTELLSYKFLKSLNLEQFEKLVDFAYYESKKFGSIFELFQVLLEKNEDYEISNIEASVIAIQKEIAMQKAYKIKEFITNCDKVTASALKAVNYENFDELLDCGKTWLTKDMVAEFSYFKKFSNEHLEKIFAELKVDIGNYYKLRSEYSLQTLTELFRVYKSFKKSFNKNKNQFSFTDISNYVYELLTTKIDKEFLYFRLDSKYDHILIDEFQDTSLLQFKILKPLIEETLSGDDGRFKTFFYVGDIKQSIYRFRGGKRELFDFVSNNYKQIEVDNLNTNYRSCQNVVDFVNNAFITMPNYEYINQLSVKENGYVEVIEDEKLNDEEKFETVAKKIAELLQKGVDSNKIAVLTYTNDDVLDLYSYLSSKFTSLKITTEMTSKLINQENVKACINAIKYLYFGEKLYLENLNAIIGNAPNMELKFSFDLKKSSIQELVLNVAKYFNMVDENVIKFVNEVSIFSDIVDFIYEIDKLESTIDSKEQNGLQILTIFKSKGLEFDTVFLIDRIKNKNIDKSSLLFDYQGVELSKAYYKISQLKDFDENYQKAIEKEQKLQNEDEINILYVAMTRAKNNMLIFKKSEKSVFDKLLLKPICIGELVIEKSDSSKISKVERIQYEKLDLGRQKSKKMIKDDIDEVSLKARYYGIATHYCLEMMSSFSIESLKKAIKLAISRYHSYLSDEDFENIKQRVSHLVNNKEFTKLIEGSKTFTEQSLIYNNEVKIIDLLTQKGENFYIFDYKTTLNEKDEHRKQVSFYKKAIKDIVKSENVFSYLVYLKDEEAILKEVI